MLRTGKTVASPPYCPVQPPRNPSGLPAARGPFLLCGFPERTGLWKPCFPAPSRRTTMRTVRTPEGEAAIWARVIESEKNGLSAEAARSLLELGFSERDKSRMNELGRKNREGRLTAAERR